MLYAILAVLHAPMLVPRGLLPQRAARRLGAAEYLFGHLRDHTFGVVSVFLAAYTQDLAWIAAAALSFIAYVRHVHAGLAMTEFMRANPTVHPQEFFERYYDRLSPNRVGLPAKASRTIDPASVDFTSGEAPVQSLKPLWRALYDTGIFARSAYRALTACGPGYGRETFDAMATLWGSRVLQLFRSRLTVTGIDALKEIEGKVVLAFTHKSHLDFVFAFFALSTARWKDGRRVRVRYIAAKDHFVDNRFVYEWLGIGKLIEAVDMVFVDRKGKGRDAIDDAAQKLAELPVDIAIFPQGTRTRAHVGPKGERLDSGYYSTGSLKKGAAHLALGAAAATEQPVQIVCFGIDGTATLVPKGSFAVQTQTHVHFELGGTISVNADTSVDAIQRGIDEGLRRAVKIDRVLADRLLVAIEETLLAEDALRLRTALDAAVLHGNTRLFSEIDAACTLPPPQQLGALAAVAERFLSELADDRSVVPTIERAWPIEAHH